MYAYWQLGHDATAVNTLTLANVSPRNHQILFNVLPVCIWFFVLLLCFLMRREMTYFVHIRTLYFQGVFAKQKHMDERTKGRAQLYGMVNRSVFVENIPSSVKTHGELVDEFRALFGASVVSGHLCPDVSSIRQIEVQIATLDEAIEATRNCCGGMLSDERALVNARDDLINQEEQQKSIILRQCTTVLSDRDRLLGETSYRGDISGREIHIDMDDSLSGDDKKSQDTDHLDLNPKQPMVSPRLHDVEDPKRHLFVGHFPFDPSNEARLINRLIAKDDSAGSQCGFLAFHSAAAATMACQVLLQQRASPMRAVPAPFPTDLIWDYLYKPMKDVRFRNTVSAVVIFFMICFWAVLASTVQAVFNLDEISKVIPVLKDFRNTTWYIFINGYVPIVALLGILAVAPFFLAWWSYRFEYTKTHSSISRGVFVRYSYLLIASTYVTVLSGSIWVTLTEITDKPNEIIQAFASALPGVSTYFISFVLAKIGLSLSNRLLRPFDLLEEAVDLYWRSKLSDHWVETPLVHDMPPYEYIMSGTIFSILLLRTRFERFYTIFMYNKVQILFDESFKLIFIFVLQ